jgi:hypothetical protein
LSTFPDGRPGAGLAILRIAVAVNAITQGICILTAQNNAVSFFSVLGLSSAVMGFAFLAGFLTPIVGSVLSFSYLVECVSLFVAGYSDEHANALTAACLASMCAAVALLGPGAFRLTHAFSGDWRSSSQSVEVLMVRNSVQSRRCD